MTASRECSVGINLVLNYIAAANAVLDAREAIMRRGPAPRRSTAEARLKQARNRRMELLTELQQHLVTHGCESIGPVVLADNRSPKNRVKSNSAWTRSSEEIHGSPSMSRP
jgi:hypothetical protein